MRNKLLSIISILLLLGVLISCNVEGLAPESVTIKSYDRVEMVVGDMLQLEIEEQGVTVEWSASNDAVTVSQYGLVIAQREGTAAVAASCNGISDSVIIEVVLAPSETESNSDNGVNGGVGGGTLDGIYEGDPADSHAEALERSKEGIISGYLTVPDQAPILSEYRPMKDGKYLLNSNSNFIDENTYVVTDAYGNEVFRVYRGGGYITLEEVAAYVYAFGDVPANYVAGKKTKPESTAWGEYLRVNHSKFSGNTDKYPYEPELPNISGCGGSLQYYEIDIGTTGTDCDPGYISKIYNDGHTITRGAARIVYGKDDLDGDGVYEFGELHVFYTYNHYNDFQEYLNYYGGWGEMFGNVTGGGTLSSKSDYNPTSYVAVIWEEFPSQVRVLMLYFCDPKKYWLNAA